MCHQEEEKYYSNSNSKKKHALIPRLLLSIDRGGSLEDAMETVQIAIDMMQQQETAAVQSETTK